MSGPLFRVLIVLVVGLSSCAYDSATGWGCRRGRSSTMQSFWQVKPGQEDALRADLQDCQRQVSEYEGRTSYGNLGVGRGPGTARDLYRPLDHVWYGKIEACMVERRWVPK